MMTGMDEQPPPQHETTTRRILRRWLPLGLALAAVLAGMAILGLIAVRGRRFWRPLPVVPPFPAAAASITCPETVPVAIASSAPSLAVACPDGGNWYAPGERFLDMGEGPWEITETDGALVFEGKPVPEGELRLLTNEDAFVLGKRSYRGDLTVKVRSDGGLRAVNDLAPEDYVAAVVGSEMYSRWPMETLMAQAVAARTFMLHTLSERGYMVWTDMAYGGVDAESRSSRLATKLTRGIILVWDDRPLPAYFQSTCGGQTVAVERMFASDPIPPLRGVDCPWCRSSRWYDWHFEMAGREIAKRLEGFGLAEVRSIKPIETEPDGYARFVLINHDVKLAAGALRSALGGNRMRSTKFQVTEQDGVFSFDGLGFGHGVGMCQWGARGMARAGHTWQEILLHYYPGAAIRKAY